MLLHERSLRVTLARFLEVLHVDAHVLPCVCLRGGEGEGGGVSRSCSLLHCLLSQNNRLAKHDDKYDNDQTMVSHPNQGRA